MCMWMALGAAREAFVSSHSIPEDATTLPESVFGDIEAKAFRVYECALESIEEIQKLAKLESVVIIGSNVAEIPAKMSEMENLTKLEIIRGKLTGLPEAIGEMKKLTCLNVRNNAGIESIPDGIGRLEALKTLDISKTRLKALPGTVGKLEMLDVS